MPSRPTAERWANELAGWAIVLSFIAAVAYAVIVLEPTPR
jgi:hypothetical protein